MQGAVQSEIYFVLVCVQFSATVYQLEGPCQEPCDAEVTILRNALVSNDLLCARSHQRRGLQASRAVRRCEANIRKTAATLASGSGTLLSYLVLFGPFATSAFDFRYFSFCLGYFGFFLKLLAST